jgi:hypothetical protein
MEAKIIELENELKKLKSQEKNIEFQKILDNILTEDFGKILENRFFEEEFGCWVDNDGNKIYKHVDEKITELNNVTYYILGKQVESIPKAEDVIKLHRFPHQICELRTVNKRYQYIFSNKFLKKNGLQLNNQQLMQSHNNNIEIYKILYFLHKQVVK